MSKLYPKELQELIEELKRLPGVGEKTAERYALSLLEEDNEAIQTFVHALVASKQKIHPCSVCGNYSNQERCEICRDESRDHQIFCVVNDVKDLIAIEKAETYHGVYHVLGGLLSAQKGIMPQDIRIEELMKRVDQGAQEVILALNATVEGEMTAMYITKKLEDKVKVTRLAFGLPIGGHLDYADDMTLIKAFEGRK